MGSYEGLHARWYDTLYAAKPYGDEARFVDRLVGARGGRLLDVACGTGRHAIAFAELGYRVRGIDLNAGLIEHARHSAAAAQLDARFDVADMRTLQLGEHFDVVTCLFDAIGYPLNNDGVVSALRSIADHLAPTGRAVVEFLHAPTLIRRASPVGVRRVDLPDGGSLLRIAETELDIVAQRMRVAYELVELRRDGTFARSTEVQSNRFFGVEEMRALMALGGLEVDAFHAAYADDASVGPETFHVLAVAGRRG